MWATAKGDEERLSPQFPIRLMNKDFGLILNLAAAGWRANAPPQMLPSRSMRRQSTKERRRFFRVILEIGKRAHLGSNGNGRRDWGVDLVGL